MFLISKLSAYFLNLVSSKNRSTKSPGGSSQGSPSPGERKDNKKTSTFRSNLKSSFKKKDSNKKLEVSFSDDVSYRVRSASQPTYSTDSKSKLGTSKSAGSSNVKSQKKSDYSENKKKSSSTKGSKKNSEKSSAKSSESSRRETFETNEGFQKTGDTSEESPGKTKTVSLKSEKEPQSRQKRLIDMKNEDDDQKEKVTWNDQEEESSSFTTGKTGKSRRVSERNLRPTSAGSSNLSLYKTSQRTSGSKKKEYLAAIGTTNTPQNNLPGEKPAEENNPPESRRRRLIHMNDDYQSPSKNNSQRNGDARTENFRRSGQDDETCWNTQKGHGISNENSHGKVRPLRKRKRLFDLRKDYERQPKSSSGSKRGADANDRKSAEGAVKTETTETLETGLERSVESGSKERTSERSSKKYSAVGGGAQQSLQSGSFPTNQTTSLEPDDEPVSVHTYDSIHYAEDQSSEMVRLRN